MFWTPYVEYVINIGLIFNSIIQLESDEIAGWSRPPDSLGMAPLV